MSRHSEGGLYLPRPLWQLQEELAEHKRLRPALSSAPLVWRDWYARKECLELWVELGEKGVQPLDIHEPKK